MVKLQIKYYIGKIFEDVELDKESVILNYRITDFCDKSYDVMSYSSRAKENGSG